MNKIEKAALIKHISKSERMYNSDLNINPAASNPNNKPWIEFDKDHNVVLVRKSLY